MGGEECQFSTENGRLYEEVSSLWFQVSSLRIRWSKQLETRNLKLETYRVRLLLNMRSAGSRDEIRLRATYLFLACSRAVEQLKEDLAAYLPSPALRLKRLLERPLRRELGLLVRYWTTRQIWQQWESNEADAKQLNLVLLRLFTDEFKLPKDGTGLRYAELSTLEDELRELGRRITNALEIEHQPLLGELHQRLSPCRDAVLRYTVEALQLPLDQLQSRISAWMQPIHRDHVS